MQAQVTIERNTDNAWSGVDSWSVEVPDALTAKVLDGLGRAELSLWFGFGRVRLGDVGDYRAVVHVTHIVTATKPAEVSA